MSRILVMEDDPVNGQVLTDLLGAQGHEVTLATTGPLGVQRFGEVRPDLVIVDVLLPEKNGFEVAFEIRQAPGGQDVPLILMSAIYTDQQQAEAYARNSLAAAAYLVKPFELSELLAAVQAALGSA
jgi:CheY-like chemotaxis protein